MNEILVKASDLVGRPAVTLKGDRRGEIKDVVLGLRSTALVGFTLRNPGFLGGPMSDTLPWESVHAVGPDAVMMTSDSSLSDSPDIDLGDAVDPTDLPVITETGDQLGKVLDVIVAIGSPPEVVGLEIEAGDAMPAAGAHLLVPLAAVSSSSGEAIVVPAEAMHFVQDDLSGFGAAVENFRSSLGSTS